MRAISCPEPGKLTIVDIAKPELQPGWVRVGIVIYDAAYWGRGFGTNALRMWVGWLADADGIHRIDLVTWSGNERMIRAARTLGMVEEGRLRDARVVRGARYDSVIMGMLTIASD